MTVNNEYVTFDGQLIPSQLQMILTSVHLVSSECVIKTC